MEKTKPPFQNPDWTFLIQPAQLPMGISHSYKLRIAQTQWRWKENSKIFPKFVQLARCYNISPLETFILE
ncbi:hypothetical protein H5410_051621 [Solanum commersonii]|uniref:Uncharacterized protein n=1 Tax=Solanum commersonii TaxID=4109 RepID=A0A9J5WYZ7_SOLCO|nr:hypothetical protein H5410_051621 [Solanum commersonii]